jgi:hypothetical protein
MPAPSADEIKQVEKHLLRFSDPLERPERLMLERLYAGEWTPFDQRFFEHERLEADPMASGMKWEEAHPRVLEMQDIHYEPGYEAYLYHPAVIADLQARQSFNRPARELSVRLADAEGD